MSAAKNLLNFFLLSFGYIVIQMALTPIRLRLLTEILGQETYGLLTFVILTINLLIVGLSFGMFEFLLRRIPGMEKQEQERLYGWLLRIYLGIVVAASLIGTAVCLTTLIGPSFNEENVIACALALVVNALLQFRIFYLLGQNELLPFRLVQLMANDLWFFVVLALWPFVDLNLTLILWIWTGWLALTMLATEYWGPLRLALVRQPAPVALGTVFAFGLPLLPLLLGELLIRYTDKVFVTSYFGPAAMGEYSATMNVALLVYLVGSNVICLLVPKFNQHRNALAPGVRPAEDQNMRKAFSVMLRYALILGGFGAGVIALLGWAVMDILVAEDFRGAIYILPWAAPAALFFLVHLVFSRVLIALDRSRLVGGLTLAAAALNAALNPLLISQFGERGILGAALATTISVALLCLATGTALGVHRWISWPHLRLGRWLVAVVLGLAMYAASSAQLHSWNPFVVLVLNGIGSVALLLLFRLVTPNDLNDLFAKKPTRDPDHETPPVHPAAH